MSFKDNELDFYPISGAEDQIEFLDEKELIIDNGSDRIKVNLDEIRHSVEHLMSEENISKIINKIRDFAERVKIDKENGAHTGSSELAKAVSGEIFLMEPEDIGFKEENEIKLLAKIVEKSCKKDDMIEFED